MGSGKTWSPFFWGVLVLLAYALHFPLQGADFAERGVTSSRHFVVYAKDAARRSQLLREAEDIREAWFKLIRFDSERRPTIIIQVIPRGQIVKGTPPFNVRLLEADGGFIKVQLDIREDAEMDVRPALLRAILLEEIYQKARNVAGKPYRFPPGWLIEGAIGMIDTWTSDPPASLFMKLIEKGDIPQLSEFLEIDPERLDATSRAVFRAQAMALLRAILDQPKGEGEIRNYLAALEKKDNGERLFLSVFRSLGGTSEKVRKYWTLMVARYGATIRIKPLLSRETVDRLDKLLAVEIPVEEGKKPQPQVEGSLILVALARDKTYRPALQSLALELTKLGLRAHPLWKPVVEGYVVCCERLARGRLGGMEKRLQELDEVRAKLRDHTEKIESYLDWYEATKLTVPSGEFPVDDGGLRRGLPRRTDPISLYLDSVEAQGWR